MAFETLPIQGLGTGTSDLSWKVPSAVEFDLMAAHAIFAGTGAAGAFKPALQIIAPSGAVMASTTGSTVTAGGSADVTFAPFLEEAATAAATVQIFSSRTDSPSPLSIPSGVATQLKLTRFQTDDGAGVALSYTGGGTQLPSIVSSSFMYSLWASVYWPAFAGVRTFALALADPNPGMDNPIEVTNSEQTQWVSGMVRPTYTAPTFVTLTLTQNSGVNQVIQNATVYIMAVTY